METPAYKGSSSSLMPLWNWERISFFQKTWILQDSYYCPMSLMLAETEGILQHPGGTLVPLNSYLLKKTQQTWYFRPFVSVLCYLHESGCQLVTLSCWTQLYKCYLDNYENVILRCKVKIFLRSSYQLLPFTIMSPFTGLHFFFLK